MAVYRKYEVWVAPTISFGVPYGDLVWEGTSISEAWDVFKKMISKNPKECVYVLKIVKKMILPSVVYCYGNIEHVSPLFEKYYRRDWRYFDKYKPGSLYPWGYLPLMKG
jgi:hypothetical protein